MAVAIVGLFIYISYSYFSFFSSDKMFEETDLPGVEETIVDDPAGEPAGSVDSEPTSTPPEVEKQPVTPKVSISQPGDVIKRGDSGYYVYNKSTIKVRVLNIGKAREEMAAAVKLDIPEATSLTIWTVIFEQQFVEGKEIYGSFAGFNLFNVETSDGSPAYILNSTGDYAGCPASAMFEEDFEKKTPYSQCFVIGSNSEPQLIFVGESNSVYASNPVVFK